mgnify:CR=1 FL=1
MKLENQTAVVSGGGRGIGKAICHFLAREGADIVTFSRTEKEIKQTEKEIGDLGVKAFGLVADVRNKEDVRRVTKKALKEFSKIDILVNNAGVCRYKTFWDIRDKDWNEIVDTNLEGVILCTREVLNQMIKQKRGKIINISSQAGKRPFFGLSVYCATKYGVNGFTKALARDLEKYSNIKVYAVCPGATATKMYFDMIPDADLKTLLKPEEVAKIVLKLALPNAKVKSGSLVDIYK